MRSALRTALGKIPGSRLVALGTRSKDPAHWFERLLHGGADYSQLHAAPDKAPPFQRRTWLRANPSLPIMPALEKEIRAEAADAKRDPVELASFRAKRLNQGVSEVLEAVLLEAGHWEACEVREAPVLAGPCAWGIDLGSTAAMSAVAAYWPATGALEVLAAFPSEPSLAARGLRDGVGPLYRQMQERGELALCGRHTVKVPDLVGMALERFGAPSVVAADRWREGGATRGPGRGADTEGSPGPTGPGVQGRRGGPAHLPAQGRGATGQGPCLPVAALRPGAGPGRHRHGRQLEAGEEDRGGPEVEGERRRGGGGHLGRVDGRPAMAGPVRTGSPPAPWPAHGRCPPVGGRPGMRSPSRRRKGPGWRCERCHGAGALEAHHTRPLQEGGELLVPVEELEVLCRDCHIEAHRARRPVIGHEAWEALVAELAAEGPPRGGRP